MGQKIESTSQVQFLTNAFCIHFTLIPLGKVWIHLFTHPPFPVMGHRPSSLTLVGNQFERRTNRNWNSQDSSTVSSSIYCHDTVAKLYLPLLFPLDIIGVESYCMSKCQTVLPFPRHIMIYDLTKLKDTTTDLVHFKLCLKIF